MSRTLESIMIRGSFGVVKLFKDTLKDNKKVALKIINKKKLKNKKLSKDKNAYSQVEAEVAIMKKMVRLNRIIQI